MKNALLENKIGIAAAMAALLLGSVGVANAQVTFFGETLGAGEASRVAPNAATTSAQTNFLAALTNPGVENLESFADGSTSVLAVFGNGVTAGLSGGNIVNVPSGTNGFGRYPISGDQFWEAGNSFTLTFNEGISAFGFFGVDIGDFNGQVNLTLFNGATSLGNFVVPNSTSVSGGGILYYGIVTPFSFDSVMFGNTAAGVDFFAFDDFTVGLRSEVIIDPTPPGAVPEPSTYGIMGAAALIGAVLVRRRMQAKK